MTDYIGSYCTICKACDYISADENTFKRHLKTYKHIVLSHGGTLDQYRVMKGYRMSILYYKEKVKDKNDKKYDDYVYRLQWIENVLNKRENRLGIAGLCENTNREKKKPKYIDQER